MNTSQAFGSFGVRGVSACAVSAVAEAIGVAPELMHCCDFEIHSRYPWCRNGKPVCPACGDRSCWGALGLAIHLNDMHHWSRQSIADHIEALDPTVPPADASSLPVAVDVLVESR